MWLQPRVDYSALEGLRHSFTGNDGEVAKGEFSYISWHESLSLIFIRLRRCIVRTGVLSIVLSVMKLVV